jgi:1,4-dihydroxy-2-naphthoate octaprenyltransferase
MKLKNFFIITRSWSLTITFISVTAATLLVLQDGRGVSFFLYFMTLLAAFLLHAGANTLNDYFDTKNHIDTPQAPTACYRPHPILALGLSAERLFTLSLFLLGASFIVGIILTIFRTGWLGPLLFFGFCLSVFYTAHPLKLKYIALGEPIVFLGFGPLMMEGTYAIQRLVFSTKTFLISLPVGSGVALVLLANNLRDVDFDAKCGIKTLPTIIGQSKAFILYVVLSMLPYFFILLYFLCGVVKGPILLVFLALPKTIGLINDFSKNVPDDADAKTSKATLLYGLLLIFGLFLEKLTT